LIEFQHLVDTMFPDPSGNNGGLALLVASLMLAVFLGQTTAWVYQRTHHGLSYSRGFTQSLVILAFVSSLLVHVIGDSLITAFGLLGALAIVRFRNVLKDTRDTTYVLAVLILGMATGTKRFGVALIGAFVLLSLLIYLHLMSFGTKTRFDGHLTYNLEDDEEGATRAGVEAILDAFCGRVHQESRHELGDTLEVVNAVRLRDPGRSSELVRLLRGTPGVVSAQLVLHDINVEM